ncbi:MAG: hypothetical protein ACFB2X_18960 [Rivularia sp. (in: cyanobacteria)]
MFAFPRLTKIETQIQALQAEAEKMREVSNVASAALNAIADTHNQLQELSVTEEELIMWQNKVVDVVGIVEPTVGATNEDNSRLEKENEDLKQEIQNLKTRLEELSKTDQVTKLQQDLKEERTRFADKIEEVSKKFFTMEQENKALKKQVEETIVNPDIQKLQDEKETFLNRWHECRGKYFDALGEIKLLKVKLGEDEDYEQAEEQILLEPVERTEEQPKEEQASSEFDVTPDKDKPTTFKVGDIVKVVGESYTGQVGRIVEIDFSLFKVATPEGTFAFLAKDLVLVTEVSAEEEKPVPVEPKAEKMIVHEPITCNEQEIEEFLKGLVRSKKARAELSWEQIREVAKRDTNFFRTIQLMPKSPRQGDIFSDLHNTRFADLLVKHIESTGDRSDFDWIPNRLKEQVESRIVNAPEQLTIPAA